MPTITSKVQLVKSLEQRATMALKATQKVVNDCIQESINEYYREKVFRGGTSNQPLLYDRTYILMNSLIKTDIIKIGNTLQCEVKIDENYLNYQYPGNGGIAGNVRATGRDILEYNNETGSHGITVDGEWKIWDEAMRSLSGDSGILLLLEKNLKKYGIPLSK